MILYITLLIKKYPDSVLTTKLLGSDQNEQLFAFIRTSYAGGRSRNLDAATLAFGTEKKNVRRRTLMRPTVPSPAVKKSSTLPFLSKTPLNRILLCGQERW